MTFVSISKSSVILAAFARLSFNGFSESLYLFCGPARIQFVDHFAQMPNDFVDKGTVTKLNERAHLNRNYFNFVNMMGQVTQPKPNESSLRFLRQFGHHSQWFCNGEFIAGHRLFLKPNKPTVDVFRFKQSGKAVYTLLAVTSEL